MKPGITGRGFGLVLKDMSSAHVVGWVMIRVSLVYIFMTSLSFLEYWQRMAFSWGKIPG